MIGYYKGAFGLNLLLRMHGSGLYRGMIPGIFSLVIYLLIALRWRKTDEEDDFNHPYAIGILASSISFLIIFRANFGYQRYWEACGAIHHMMSKWLDATTHTSIYHMQQDHYNKIKPPSFYDHFELNDKFLTRDREVVPESERVHSERGKKPQREHKSIEMIDKYFLHHDDPTRPRMESNLSVISEEEDPMPLTGDDRLDGGWKYLFPDHLATYYKPKKSLDKERHDPAGFASIKGGHTPALFLQELAHLSSLLNAVALSTLRNDVDGASSPLDVYVPGSPWPEVDPDNIPRDPDEKRNYFGIIKHLMGADRTPEARTKYNASRPLHVIGGVSDNEIKFLQMARGPSAKVQLCWNWLSEFVIREHLAGSTGKVGPPIISRVIQFLGDGMIFYNHGRKIMFIPFPFPHAQLSVFFVTIVALCIPLLMDQYTNEVWLGALLTFLTVTCLAGLHEVARELENPFRNVPNDLPLCTLQAMYNEALFTMYAGFHPDAYWEADEWEEADADGGEENNEDHQEKPSSDQAQDNDSKSEIAQCQSLIEKQSKEIERLRLLVEGNQQDSGGSSQSVIKDCDQDNSDKEKRSVRFTGS